MDDTDMKLLRIMAHDSRTSLADMAKEVGLSISGVRRRILALQRGGVIRGYSIDVDPRKYGYSVTAFVTVEVDSRGTNEFMRGLSKRHEVCEIHRITGDHSVLLKVRARDVDGLNKFIEDHVRSSVTVKGVRTVLVMETMKETMMNL